MYILRNIRLYEFRWGFMQFRLQSIIWGSTHTSCKVVGSCTLRSHKLSTGAAMDARGRGPNVDSVGAMACVSLQTSSSLPLETLKWFGFLKFDDWRSRESLKTQRFPADVLQKCLRGGGAGWVQRAWIAQDRPRWPRKTEISLLCLSLCAPVCLCHCLSQQDSQCDRTSFLILCKINCVLPIARPRVPVCYNDDLVIATMTIQ